MKRFFVFLFASLVLCCALGWSVPAYAVEVADQDDSISMTDNIPTVEEFLYDNSNGFMLDHISLTLTPDAAKTLTAKWKQADVTRDVIWITSDRDIATVQGGEVTAVDFGICTVTAKTTDGLRASCTILVTPDKAAFRTVKKCSAGKVSISWREISGATGYQLYRATSKDGTYSKVKTFSDAETTSFTNTVTRNKKYYYKVRAYYKTGDGTYLYGAWSDIQSVNISN